MENTIKEICQGCWKTYEVFFKKNKYFVKVENDDFNNFDITITDKDDIEVDDDLKEEIENYLDENKIL